MHLRLFIRSKDYLIMTMSAGTEESDMKKMQLLAVILAFALMLCSCSNGEAATSHSESQSDYKVSFYVTSQIYWEDFHNVVKISQNADRLAWAGFDGRVYTKNIQDTNAKDITPELKRNQSVTCAAPGSAGQTVFVVTEYDDSGKISNEIIMTETSGNPVEQVSISDYGIIEPTMIAVDDMGNIALGREDGTVYVFSSEMAKIAQTSFSQLSGLFAISGKIGAFASSEIGEKNVYTFDHECSEFLKSTPIPADVSQVFVAADGTLLLENSQGICDTMENQVFSWRDLGLAHGQMVYLYGLSSTKFYYYAASSDKFVLISDVPPVQNEDTITLTLACWMQSVPLMRSVMDFNLSQNEYQVEIVDYYSDDADPYQGMARMNADLLSGNAPDIYALNSMNAVAFQNAGLLLDLSPIINADPYFSREDYLPQCWEFYTQDGHQYQLAPTFVLCGVIGPASVLEGHKNWNMPEYLNCLAEDKMHYGIYCNNETVMTDHCIRYTLGDTIDMHTGTCNFETDSFYEVLAFCKSYRKSNTKDGLLIPGWIDSVSEFSAWKDDFGGSVDIAGFPNAKKTGPVWDCIETFAIGSGSKNQEGAWSFLKFMLQDYAQTNIWGSSYFPVNKAAFEYVLDGAKYPGNDSRSTLAGNRETALTDADVALIRTTVDQLSDVAFRNDDIWNIIHEEVPAYYSGDKTDKEVAKLIQNRVSIYLDEQS